LPDIAHLKNGWHDIQSRTGAMRDAATAFFVCASITILYHRSLPVR